MHTPINFILQRVREPLLKNIWSPKALSVTTKPEGFDAPFANIVNLIDGWLRNSYDI